MSEVVFDVTPAEVVVDAVVAEVVVTTGPAGPQGPAGTSGVVAATSPITYDSGTQTVAFDQSAQNTTNDGRYARLAAANAFTVGGHTITNASAAVVPLTIKAVSGQTGNSLEIKDSSNGVRFSVSEFGTVAVGAGTVGGTRLSVQTATASVVGLVIRGAASQTANLFEAQSSAGSILAWITSAGNFVSAGQVQAGSGLIRLQSANSGGQIQIQRQTAAAGNPGANNATIYFRDGTTAGTLKLVVRAGAAGAETTILDNIPQ